MIDIDETLYNVISRLPSVEHVAIDEEDEQIYLIVTMKDESKRAIVMGKEEFVVNALMNIDFTDTPNKALDKKTKED